VPSFSRFSTFNTMPAIGAAPKVRLIRKMKRGF